MKQTLNLKLSQQLTLTPQLKQSLKLLQLPSLDLELEIQQVLDSNPLLERIEQEVTPEEQIQTFERAQDNGIPQPVGEAADPGYEIEQTDHLAPEQDLAINWQESFESHRANNSSSGSQGTGDTEFTQFAFKQETLFEHLDWQIQMTSLSQQDKLIAQTILHSLDHDGYLVTSLSDIVALLESEIDIEEDEVAAMLSLVKSLEPAGVGARDLSERLSMLLALEADQSAGIEVAKVIVEKHLNLVGTHNLAQLKKQLNISDQGLSNALSLITRLNPRVSAPFQSDAENHIIPDVVIKKINQSWVAQLNAENQTKLRVNVTYSDLLKASDKAANPLEKKDSDYIQHNLLEAKMFIKGLMSRYDTLLLVTKKIVERQQGFFNDGEQAMQPMVLQDIAEALEMHESTISRATSGKYLLCPRGVFELKFFFSSALSTTDGAASSSTAIRSFIKKMVEAENKVKPLSDSKIAKELEQQGHIVARRTVAKYRESMHIAPSSQRKSLV
ncbi:MAG: RNA polymerase sigma-54 factor [Arenicella sp.]|jgi:RNA polymerase sigma-54 factor